MAAFSKPYGLKHDGREDHFKPVDLKHTDFAHQIKKPGMNQTPGNADAPKKQFTKSHPLVNPAHKGYCSPTTKSTCTPRRKAFAERVKREGGFH